MKDIRLVTSLYITGVALYNILLVVYIADQQGGHALICKLRN